MDPITGFAIAGLAMHSCELALKNHTIRKLENPGVATKVTIAKPDYSLEDVAKVHLQEIKESIAQQPSNDVEEYRFIGMSMGGMILSIIASEYRNELPANSHFYFLVTSANTPDNRAVPDSLLQSWMNARPGNVATFNPILEPFFSKSFVDLHADKVEDYVRYRALGMNQQSPKEFMRQLNALRNFDGRRYFSRLRPSETTIISGADDYILGPKHHDDLVALTPGATHVLVPRLGHMINIENPDYINSLVEGP